MGICALILDLQKVLYLYTIEASAQQGERTSGSKFMSESKIVIAMKEFIEDYAWDKSLINSDSSQDRIHAAAPDYVHSNTYLDEFLESYRQKLAVEQHREVAKV